MFVPENFYELLRPIFLITKMFGLSPFCVNKTSYRNSKINMLISVCIMLFFSLYISIGLSKKESTSEGFIVKVAGFLDAYLTMLGTFCGILFGCIFVNDVRSIVAENQM